MWRYIFIAVSVIGFAVEGPRLAQSYLGSGNEVRPYNSGRTVTRNQRPSEDIQVIDDRSPSQRRVDRKSRKKNPLSSRSVSTKMARNGQFYFNTKMNGASVKVMVDTGATGVAINQSTARRMGIRLKKTAFKYKSQNANGIALYARATIDEIRIGRIVVNNVSAAVLKDTSLKSTLLGMTFLNKLRKFEVNNGTLILTQ